MKSRGDTMCCCKENAYKHGRFKRRSDGQWIQRYRCKTCRKAFSQASFDPAYYQKKRHLNYKCLLLLTSSVSMRRTALILGVDRKTVSKKLIYLAEQCRQKSTNEEPQFETLQSIQFDELQTIEHTKCKPVSVAMAVSGKNRKILGFQVSVMPATGHLASISRQKYGPRKDDRFKGMTLLFQHLNKILKPTIEIQSDECIFYQKVVTRFFPKSTYSQFKGQKSSVSGQGELKKTYKDPLFAINHTFAMLRANINRLVRKSWCTTKHITRLVDHLSLYVWVHNNKLTPNIIH